jgi:hypothetical protein
MLNPWHVGALKFVGMHETGHALLTRRHITNAPYYGDSSFGHVMSIRSYWFQGSFSPLEVIYGIKTLKWKLKPNARHPFCDLWLAMPGPSKTQFRETMLKICTPYAEFGLYRPIGDSEIDGLMAKVPVKAVPKMTWEK